MDAEIDFLREEVKRLQANLKIQSECMAEFMLAIRKLAEWQRLYFFNSGMKEFNDILIPFFDKKI